MFRPMASRRCDNHPITHRLMSPAMALPPLFVNFAPPMRKQSALRQAITAASRRPEPECLASLLDQATLPDAVCAAARVTATKLITALRAKHRGSGVEGLVQEYALSSEEG